MKYSRHISGIKAFGKHLRKLRIEKGLSQEQLAWKAEMELSQISRIERGIISTGLSQLFMLSEALDLKPKDLFDFELEPE